MYQAGLPQASDASGRLDVPIKVADGSIATERGGRRGVRSRTDRYRNLCAAPRSTGKQETLRLLPIGPRGKGEIFWLRTARLCVYPCGKQHCGATPAIK